MGFSIKGKRVFLTLFILLMPLSAAFAAAPTANSSVVTSKTGTIRGVIRDDGGSPIAAATVAIFRAGTSRLLKQVVSSPDGSFLAKIVPGTYTVLAVAQGFNPTYLFGVEVGKAADLSYGFKLERAGSGDTLPEKRLDRNSSKWRIRGAQTQRSIYQNQEGNEPIDEDVTAANTLPNTDSEEHTSRRRGQTVVESYVAGSESGNYAVVNFATLIPVNENTEVVVAGQTGTGKISPQRFEADMKLRSGENHQLRFNSAASWLGNIVAANKEKPLGQFSFQALDEWKVREGIVLVFGIDYSRFVGAGNDDSLSPRLGLQYDLNSKTRFRTSYTTQTEEKTWARAIELEGESVSFVEPVSVADLVLADGKPQINKSRRLEFGIERVIDDSSSVDTNVFFDTTLGRGVGLNSLSFDTLGGEGFGDFVADQQGKAQGISIVYTRRLSKLLTASGGYSYGSGQALSTEAITDPSHVFENDFFQSFFGQLAAELTSGTSFRTVFRLSPRATVFAIDPFRGRLAIYDPGLSVMVTQILPTFGLPLRAEAIIDGRNLLDFQSGIFGEEGSLKLTGHQRMLRGGIQVRF
ncbi:MAG: TonB-dependent receptor [Chloracidobacterium sp.]|nr:TonB-dependent receptor [Chloracidobacterium sp.]